MNRQNIRDAISKAWVAISKVWVAIWDPILKLALPLTLGLGGYYVQQSIATTQMLVERERADTEIRAQMFKSISEGLFKGQKDQPLSPVDQAVFAQLLALNFHEHIEMKPLMLDIEGKLLRMRASPTLSKWDIASRREELYSVARRVQARQLAMLVSGSSVFADSEKGEKKGALNILPIAHAKESWKYQNGAVRYLGIRFAGIGDGANSGSGIFCAVLPNEGHDVLRGEPIVEASPDGENELTINAASVDSERQRFTLRVGHRRLPGGRASEADATPTGSTPQEFEVTWFDFPLTDNTVLSSGARFSIFIDRVCERPRTSGAAGEVVAARFGLLWFPKDYFPARERPTNFSQLRQKLGLTIGGDS